MNLSQAFRNLIRHQTRSLLSLITISSAMASIILFLGYSTDVMVSLKSFGVESQYGHLQIADKKNWNPESQKLKDTLTVVDDQVLKKISELPEFRSMSPRLSLQALLNHDDSQFGARLVGYNPLSETNIFNNVQLIGEAKPFQTGDELEILLGIGLMRRLKAKPGQSLTIVTQTVDGVVNAMDVMVRGSFATSVSEIDDQTAYIPIQLAQKLLETNKIENWIILIKEMDMYSEVSIKIQSILKSDQSELEVKTWKQLANLYNQVEEFYGLQNIIIQIILSTLTFLAVINTVGMTVYERTGEIGTLRALGATKSDIIKQFMTEGLLLAILASLLGFIFGTLAIMALNSSDVFVNLPGSSVPVPLKAEFSIDAYFTAFVCALISTLLGNLIPAIRASQLKIVEALRKNI